MERDNLGRFVSGRVETEEERLKRVRACSESWKNRKDYIGDIKNKCPKIYGSWRGIRFTDKGKAAGCCEEWGDFRTFFNAVYPTFKPGLVLRRKDTCLPWGPDNFMWVTPKEAGVLRTTLYLEYNGERKTLYEWANELDLPISAIKQRYRKHKEDFSVEEILFGRKRNRGIKAVKDFTESGKSIRSKASKMLSSYKRKDFVNGFGETDLTVDWIIANIITKPCVYCGDTHRVGCDRIDNSRGHTKDNVVPCCIECNTARNNYFTYEEMLKIGSTIKEIKLRRGINLEENLNIIPEEMFHDTAWRARNKAKPIYQFTLNGEFVAEYSCAQEAASAVGASEGAIREAASGRGSGKTKHKLRGYLWFKQKVITIEIL